MLSTYRTLLAVHVAFGFLGLVAFWFPIFSKKGRTMHKRAGSVFLWSGYVVATTAIAVASLTIVDPFGTHPQERPADPADVPAAQAAARSFSLFLAYLGVITLASIHHGVRAMQTKKEPGAMRTPFHTIVNGSAVAASAVVLAAGIATGEVPLIALSPLGIAVGLPALRYARRPRSSRMAHWYEHMGAMIGGGIAFHTAFAVFGVQRFIQYESDGFVGILPWILPGIAGTVASFLWQKHYRRKFGELEPAPKVATPTV
ncbi:MAG: hypothetical protein ACT4OM_04600 [Actinomycetota bacterium]